MNMVTGRMRLRFCPYLFGYGKIPRAHSIQVLLMYSLQSTNRKLKLKKDACQEIRNEIKAPVGRKINQKSTLLFSI